MIHCKRYLATAGVDYYAGWRMTDFVGIYDSIDEAVEAGQQKDVDWISVFDLLTEKEVAFWYFERSTSGSEWRSQEIEEDGDKT